MKWFQVTLAFIMEDLLPKGFAGGLGLLLVGAMSVADEPCGHQSFPPRANTELALPNGDPIRVLCFCNRLVLLPGIKTGDQLLRESRKPIIERIYSYRIEGSKDIMVLLRYPNMCEYWALESDGKFSNIRHSASCKRCAEAKEKHHARPKR